MKLFLVAAAMAVVTAGCGGQHRCSPAFDTQAHRGGSAQRPENTLPAMEFAVSKGVRTLELDLAVTSDDVLVLSHDPILREGRCVKPDGSPADGLKIRQTTLAELRTLDCGAATDPDFPDMQTVPNTPPPTLSEVFAMAESRSGGRIRYNIEPKMDPLWGDDVTPPVERFMDLVEAQIAEAGTTERVVIQSFDPRPLRALHVRHSALKRAVLLPSDKPAIHGAWAQNNPVDTAVWVGAVALSMYAPLTQKPPVDEAHLRGLAVLVWTVNDEAEMDRLADLGVDGIISDDVELLMDWASRKKPSGGVCW